MLVTTYRFDEAKYERIKDKAESLHGDLMRIAERRLAARDRLNAARRRVSEWGEMNLQAAPTELTDPVDAYQSEFDKVDASYHRAEAHWQEYAVIATCLADAVDEWDGKNTGKTLPGGVVGHADAEAARFANTSSLLRG